jgi:hypothetical protein
VLSIKELAGHQRLNTIERYMHLRPAVVDDAIPMLETSRPVTDGETLEATGTKR